MANELQPEIVFLDFYMPDLSGVEVLKDLRSSETLRGTAVVLHSTKVLEGAELEFFQQNTAAIFPKQALALPDSAVRLRDLLEALASHRGTEASQNA
jgi:CheY-like chemotaxis protein